MRNESIKIRRARWTAETCSPSLLCCILLPFSFSFLHFALNFEYFHCRNGRWHHEAPCTRPISAGGWGVGGCWLFFKALPQLAAPKRLKASQNCSVVLVSDGLEPEGWVWWWYSITNLLQTVELKLIQSWISDSDSWQIHRLWRFSLYIWWWWSRQLKAWLIRGRARTME